MDVSVLLSCMFGTKEYVDMRRDLVLLTEELLNQDDATGTKRQIFTGSFGEGVAYPPSDEDSMKYLTFLYVVKTMHDARGIGNFLMIPSETSPGYCLLKEISCTKIFPDAHVYVYIENMRCLSSLLFKRRLLSGNYILHGPCLLSLDLPIDFDECVCFACPFWPDIASEWVTRTRPSGWPSLEQIQNIVQLGCHVVPIGDPDSIVGDHQWRLSFSVAERTLMHSFNHVQFLTYNILRCVLKTVLEDSSPGVLCTYFMKTTIFYTIEKQPSTLWHVENIDACYRACLSVLYDFIENKYCPNYFVESNNMFTRKINQENKQTLLMNVEVLIMIGIAYVIHSSNFGTGENEIEWMQDVNFINSGHLGKAYIMFSLLNMSSNDVNEPYPSLIFKTVQPLLQGLIGKQPELFNILVPLGLARSCHTLMSRFVSTSKGNRKNYQNHKAITSLLRLGYNVDVTTGKLNAATYMYLLGKTGCALSVIKELFSKYPKYAIDGKRSRCQKDEYMENMCGQGYRIDYKARHATAPTYILRFSEISIFPSALQSLIALEEYLALHPLTYAYVLESLIHIRLKDNESLMESTEKLVKHLDDDMSYSDVAYGRLCVGIIKFAQGDNQSACKWFSSAYLLKDKLFPKLSKIIYISALMHIACLIYKEHITQRKI